MAQTEPEPPFHLLLEASETGAAATALKLLISDEAHEQQIRGLAREVLATSGKFLGRGCAMLIDILNPQRIVIGSIFLRCRPHLLKAMEEEIAREALPSAARVCQIVPAALGESIGDFASLAVAIPPDEGERNGPS